MKNTINKLNVFNYTDYRIYLKDYYKSQKETNPVFSYRFFTRRLGINAIGLLKDVIEGRKSLGRTLVVKFCTALGLNKKEAEYFEAMVFFCEASTIEEKKLFFQRMISFHESKAAVVDKSKYEFYSKWYYSAVRALLSYCPFDGNFNKLARKLKPPIRPDQAKKAIEVLEGLGFIYKVSKDKYRLADANLSTGVLDGGKNLNIINIINFQKAIGQLGYKSIDLFPTKKIDLSTLTISISDRTYQIIKEEVTALRKKIVTLAANEVAADRVYQILYQVFPLTAIGETE